MTVTDDDGTTIEVTEPRMVKLVRALVRPRRQARMASIAHGELIVAFAEPHRRLALKWAECEGE